MKIIINGEIVEVAEGGSGDTTFLVKAPIGTIVIWSGAQDAIPSGWQLCDGTNGTPDLRDKFVLGAGSTYEVGATGGEKEHLLTKKEMPAHSHAERIFVSDAEPSASLFAGSNGTNRVYAFSANAYASTTGAIMNTTNSGNSDSHNNMPPYYALCYIMKLTADPAVDGVTMDQVNTAIQTAVADIQPQEVYSTEETRIGTWIDGKPLYRVALSTKNLPTNTGSTSSLYTFSEEVSIVYMLGAIDGASDATYIVNGSVASCALSQTTSYVLKYVPSAKTILMVGSNGEFANKEIRLIVAYTKNADEATS